MLLAFLASKNILISRISLLFFCLGYAGTIKAGNKFLTGCLALLDSTIEDGFVQEGEAACEEFIPCFDGTGVEK